VPSLGVNNSYLQRNPLFSLFTMGLNPIWRQYPEPFLSKIVGVTRQAVDQWESNNIPNASSSNGNTPLDLRQSVPKKEHPRPYSALKNVDQ
jgi:hypothetical protein